MKKNVLMLHGYNGIPQIYKWLEKELQKMNYSITMPEFPPQEGVQYAIWENILHQYKDTINEETIVIAHSIGNEFIIKYLNKNKIKIKLYISLAGFGEIYEVENKQDLNRAIREFVVNKEEIETFKKLAGIKYSIYSDNDHIVPLTVLENFPKQIEANPIFIQGIGHMGSKSGLETIPQVIDIIKKEKK